MISTVSVTEDTTSSTTSSTLLLRCQEGEVCESADFEKASASKDSGLEKATGMKLPRVLSNALRQETWTTAQNKQQPASSTVLPGNQPGLENLADEVLNFPTNCPECGSPADTKMKLTSKLSLFV